MKLKVYFLFFFFSAVLYSQGRLILRADGKVIKPGGLLSISGSEIIPLSVKQRHQIEKKSADYNSIQRWDDTLSYNVPPMVNFGFFGQDRLVQWFEAPTDMIIKAAGFNIAAADRDGTEVELKLVRLNWTKEKLIGAGVKRWGYYTAEGNGYNNATAFWNDPDRTGDWVDVTGDSVASPFGEDLWSDNGTGFSILPSADGQYQWVPLDSNIVVEYGGIIGVVLKNKSPVMDENRIGVLSDNTLGIPGFKYYANGRLDKPNDFGWWSRNYTWDLALVVELGHSPYPIEISVPFLPTTMSNEPRLVEAVVYNNNPAVVGGIDTVYLRYTIDEGASFVNVEMDSTGTNSNGGTIYSGYIPPQQPGTHVGFYVSVIDNNGQEWSSWIQYYFIYKPYTTNLLVFNGFDTPTGYPQSYYFGYGDFVNYNIINWEHDIWSYGKLTPELVENYNNIIEITTNGPDTTNNDVIKNWLEADGARNYLLAGDEWLGVQSGWADSSEHSSGEFHYDILGIKTEYNDINYSESGDQQKPTIVFPVAGSLLGDSLASLFNSVGDTMWYNPVYEIGQSNWLDGVEFLDDVETDMKAIGKEGRVYSIAGHRTLPAGNKIVFLAYDPISLDAPDSQYFWYGFTSAAPQVQALRWFGVYLTDVEERNSVVSNEFKLYQNYPNPFNPSTVIKYSIPLQKTGVETQRLVQLNVYDILGRRIATLVNENKAPGIYVVEFNATGLSSGVYIYRLKTGGFIKTGKMLLMK